jgi:type II secretory pathway pseudopilin PulG
MATRGTSGLRTIIQVVLAIAILALAFVLFRTIREPQQQFVQQQEQTRQVRERMTHLRTALTVHERRFNRYPVTLDSLVQFVRTDSIMVARRDSVFNLQPNQTLVVDSLPFSPRTGNRFIYEVNQDTTETRIYMLRDPDSNDQIGDTTPDPLRRNVATWE